MRIVFLAKFWKSYFRRISWVIQWTLAQESFITFFRFFKLFMNMFFVFNEHFEGFLSKYAFSNFNFVCVSFLTFSDLSLVRDKLFKVDFEIHGILNHSFLRRLFTIYFSLKGLSHFHITLFLNLSRCKFLFLLRLNFYLGLLFHFNILLLFFLCLINNG